MKKIKVGIISHYYNNNNYGGMLQAYALCKFLNSNEIESVQISYSMADKNFAYRSRGYKLLRKSFRLIKNKVQVLPHFLTSIRVGKRKKTLKKFRNSIPHTKRVYDLKSIKKCKEFDVYITGSDQVWNPDWCDDAFLLNFVDCDKVKLSYAASIGKSNLMSESKSKFRNALKTYAAISVREDNAVKILQEVVDNRVELVLDPTLLLDRNEWENICEGECPKSRYVFCYFLGDNIKQRTLAFEYAKQNGYELVSIPYLNGKYRKVDADFKCTQVYDLSPGRFLNMIKNAECVFTDSFHATVFSHIFQRDFFVFIHSGSYGMSDRLYTLSNMFGTRNRVCCADKTDIRYLLKTSAVDYSKEFLEFEQIKRNSINFLKDNVAKRVCD